MQKLELRIPELPFAVEEAMNRLRVNIKFSGMHTRKIMVASTFPNEGKSTVAFNLWRMMAEAGFPTVLVDADLRKSVFKERHSADQTKDFKGLAYYLSGQAEYEDVVYATNVENGYVVPIAEILENPSNLLEDARFKELLNRLAEDYRFVIIDSPPIDSVSDGSLIAARCDGAILVIRAGETPKSQIRESLQQIQRVGCPLIGTVLNRVETRSASYGRYGRYGSYYKYGYGYGYGREK